MSEPPAGGHRRPLLRIWREANGPRSPGARPLLRGEQSARCGAGGRGRGTDVHLSLASAYPAGPGRRRLHGPHLRHAPSRAVARGTTAFAQRGVSCRMRRISRRSLLGGSGSGTRSESSGSVGSSWYSSERVRIGATTSGSGAGPRNTPAFRSAFRRSGLLIAPLRMSPTCDLVTVQACRRGRSRRALPPAADTTLRAFALLHERRTASGRPSGRRHRSRASAGGGPGREIRTPMTLRSSDFESDASAVPPSRATAESSRASGAARARGRGRLSAGRPVPSGP